MIFGLMIEYPYSVDVFICTSVFLHYSLKYTSTQVVAVVLSELSVGSE
jgi:hypothetical protein